MQSRARPHAPRAALRERGLDAGRHLGDGHLAGGLPGSDTSVVYATASVAANRWKLTRAPGAGAAVTVADYVTSSTIFTYTAPGTGTLGRLSVDIPVNLNPSDTSTLWRLEDDIVLRNTTRL